MVEQYQTQQNDTKQQCDIVVLGHVNVGKSTLCGRLLLDFGMISNRDIDRLKQEAIKYNMESWWLAYLVDQDPQERTTGTTIQVSRTQFETPNRKYNITDCGGHQRYVSLMANSVLQANFAIVVVSALNNEYEASVLLVNNGDQQYEGSLRQHFKILRASNCKYVIVAINKMDDESINWSQQVFNQRANAVRMFVSRLYRDTTLNLDNYLKFIPISAQTGENVVTSPRQQELYNWYTDNSLVTTLEQFYQPYTLYNDMNLTDDTTLRVSVITTFPNESSDVYISKVESGVLSVNDKVVLYPQNIKSKIKSIKDVETNQIPQDHAFPGQKVCLQLQDVQLQDQQCAGSIISRVINPPCVSSLLEVEIHTYLLPNGVILSKGGGDSYLMMHIHSASVNCQITKIKQNINQQGKITHNNYINSMYRSICNLQLQRPIAFEKIDINTQSPYSRFILRIGQTTVAYGKILRFSPIEY